MNDSPKKKIPPVFKKNDPNNKTKRGLRTVWSWDEDPKKVSDDLLKQLEKDDPFQLDFPFVDVF